MHFTVPFILASASPRRRALLESIGLPFTVEISGIDEEHPENFRSPSEVVETLAFEKAHDVARHNREALVLGADTLVSMSGSVMGKPVDEHEAKEMLGRLSGGTNTVFTGIALLHLASGRSSVSHASTGVTFATLTDEEIERYVASAAPLDKAGAYGIQGDMGALFISGIEGDYFNVVGLPLHTLYRMLRSDFSDLLQL